MSCVVIIADRLTAPTVQVMTTTKTCKTCNETKPVTEFWVNGGISKVTGEHYRRGSCKACCGPDNRKRVNTWQKENRDRANAYQREWSRARPELRWAHRIKHLYGMTAEQYAAKLAAQNGTCAICHQAETGLDRSGNVKPFAVDHDHACCAGHRSCGKCVRGLLCQKCNSALGLLNDSAAQLRTAADYLDSFNLGEAA